MNWNFDNIPVRLRNRVVNSWRKGDTRYVVAVVKEHAVFSGNCDNCLREQLKEWITWAIEDPVGPLRGYGDKYKQ